MRSIKHSRALPALAIAMGLMVPVGAFAHGDVQPQPVDTTGLEPVGKDWKEKNPYVGNPRAIEIGASGYNQNCARCHGLDVVSGGLAPDLRFLEKGKEGDDVFVERMKHGAIINGMTKMPAFEGVLSQEAMWAIRAFLESKYQD